MDRYTELLKIIEEEFGHFGILEILTRPAVDGKYGCDISFYFNDWGIHISIYPADTQDQADERGLDNIVKRLYQIKQDLEELCNVT